ncbi:MAG: 3-phosphoshikimate 1-carboxyvinyltransferase [Flavobacteriales bacterium MED-G22]|nr:MAG: 3-phosphoshikimate 1-carboxyvinyltransferase [Flavobacteriales bacterium MED-G22]|tara:strand:+ start:1190 stop:2407 length:1218 start_codon:yes stop_codon:yes gene_type:complete
MKLHLSHPSSICEGELQITGSKSETNRLLLLQALYPEIVIKNGSESDDSVAMRKALTSDSNLIDVHHAGTAMRFLTAYFAFQKGRNVVLTGSKRMQERPIKILVEALRSLGAKIEYQNLEGFPPLIIHGTDLHKNKVTLPAQVSSQYITALMLIAPRLENGLSITLEGKITSMPYLKMTQSLLESLGIEISFEGQIIEISPTQRVVSTAHSVESDWSSASYFFSIVALAKKAKIELQSFKPDSIQGDAGLMKIYENLGVVSRIDGATLVLEKKTIQHTVPIELDLTSMPDIAQTIAVSCFGLGIPCTLFGLHTLKIKETDRLVALKEELSKVGAKIEVTENSLHLSSGSNFIEGMSISTYNDHRMALAFAPLAIKTPLIIEDSGVVSKSYPTYWEDLKTLQFEIH